MSDSAIVSTKYLRDYDGMVVGVLSGVFKEGKIGIGVSVKNPKEKCDKALGRRIAEGRAFANLGKVERLGDVEREVRLQLIDTLPGYSKKVTSSGDRESLLSGSLGYLWFWRNCDINQTISTFKYDFLFKISKKYMESFKK